MKCPHCSQGESKVTDSRDFETSVRRRRQCLLCGQRFTTYERSQVANLVIIKRDGKREEFRHKKLATGIRKACEKRPIALRAVGKLVDDVERELRLQGKLQIPSSVVGDLVMVRLRGLDYMAYVRFASAYRDFVDIETLEREMDRAAPAAGDRVSRLTSMTEQESPRQD